MSSKLCAWRKHRESRNQR